MLSFGVDHILTGAIGGLFLFAASFKTLDGSPLTETLRELGVGFPLARVGARVIPVFELTCGLAIILVPNLWLSLLLLIAAAGGIGAVGVVALRLPASIRCACFSARSEAALGWRQVILAACLGIAAGLLVAVGPSVTLRQSLVTLVFVSLLATTGHILSALTDVRESVHGRRLMSNSYPA
jgi:hypothetical protein